MINPIARSYDFTFRGFRGSFVEKRLVQPEIIRTGY
jgi:hypothetical protein